MFEVGATSGDAPSLSYDTGHAQFRSTDAVVVAESATLLTNDHRIQRARAGRSGRSRRRPLLLLLLMLMVIVTISIAITTTAVAADTTTTVAVATSAIVNNTDSTVIVVIAIITVVATGREKRRRSRRRSYVATGGSRHRTDIAGRYHDRAAIVAVAVQHDGSCRWADVLLLTVGGCRVDADVAV